MGWTSTGDPYSHVGDSALDFDTEEAAKEFAERHGWEYVVCFCHSNIGHIKFYVFLSLQSAPVMIHNFILVLIKVNHYQMDWFTFSCSCLA